MELINNLNGLATQGAFMLLPVVTAEVQFTSAGQDRANVGLGSTAIASICRRECGSKLCSPAHLSPLVKPVANSVTRNHPWVDATPMHFAQGVGVFTSAHAAWGRGFTSALT